MPVVLLLFKKSNFKIVGGQGRKVRKKKGEIDGWGLERV